ncbi:hypothetical protein B0J11DRAFT_80559 [Dendryphion nanum]|uniref:Uncharacterized protein n=1 Tax=Dendryphion nanum TaxID=256645 RepID=A0A9P9IGL6_9PLEO|nr:hypothetical protein B0J11DRAFT_80559 [Dendryphion nanum]
MTLTRTSIASLVCPYAPFLAPQFLRSSLPVAIARPPCLTGTRRLTKASCMWYPKKMGQWSRQPEFLNTQHEKNKVPIDKFLRNEAIVMRNFKTACDHGHPPAIIDLYPQLISLPTLDRDVTRRMAQVIHAYIRSRKTTKQDIRAIWPLVERIVADIRTGRLPPHPLAHRHILSIYKEREEYQLGLDFWHWLVNQDDTFVDPSVYGAAIELLAFRGDITLQALEDLFAQALKRFPGTFAEYHLSSDAIVPDRTQPFSVVGVPITLLQGILTARILARDWKNAYLALDTALRIHPSSLPPRFFELFTHERPLSEAYTVFLIACRSGIQLKSNHLMGILSRLKAAIKTAVSMEDRLALVRAMTNAIYAFTEVGGTIEGPHLSVLLNSGYAGIMPPKKLGQDFPGESTEFRNSIATSAHQIASKLLQSGFPDQGHVLVALINIAGTLGVPGLFTVALNDLETYHLDIGRVGHRVVLTAAGKLGDRKAIERQWAIIAREGQDEGTSLYNADWVSLARACRRAGHEEFYLAQVKMLKHAITVDSEEMAQSELLAKDEEAEPPFTPMDPDIFSEQMESIEVNMTRVAAVLMAGQPLDLQKTPFDMHIDPTSKPYGGSITNLRAVYDELTTDPHQPARTSTPKEAHSSPTGIPLGELRFQNWSSIVELMAEAEANEQRFQKKIDKAISESRPFYDKNDLSSYTQGRVIKYTLARWEPSYEELLAKIKNLRAPYSSQNVANRYLPPRSRPNGSKNARWISTKIPLRVYTSAKSSHIAPVLSSERPSSFKYPIKITD